MELIWRESRLRRDLPVDIDVGMLSGGIADSIGATQKQFRAAYAARAQTYCRHAAKESDGGSERRGWPPRSMDLVRRRLPVSFVWTGDHYWIISGSGSG